MFIIKRLRVDDECQKYFNKNKGTYWDKKEKATTFIKLKTAQKYLDILEKKWRNIPNVFKPPLTFELSKDYRDTPISKVYEIEEL